MLNTDRVVVSGKQFKFIDKMITKMASDTQNKEFVEFRKGYPDPIVLLCVHN